MIIPRLERASAQETIGLHAARAMATPGSHACRKQQPCVRRVAGESQLPLRDFIRLSRLTDAFPIGPKPQISLRALSVPVSCGPSPVLRPAIIVFHGSIRSSHPVPPSRSISAEINLRVPLPAAPCLGKNVRTLFVHGSSLYFSALLHRAKGTTSLPESCDISSLVDCRFMIPAHN